MKHRLALALACVALSAPRASAEVVKNAPTHDTASPLYLATTLTTTLSSRAPTGTIDGPEKDVTIGLGIGHALAHALFVELDAGSTFVQGNPPVVSLMPGIGWAFHPNFYAALRAVVPVHPALGLALDPGLGARAALDDAIAVYGELNLCGTIAPGERDVGLTFTVGATVNL